MSDAPISSDPPAAGKQAAYRVLARKYRPADFTTLIGQEPMVRTLTNAFEAGRIAQAWMLTGVRGVGKTTTARILARALNYKTDSIDRPSVDLTVPGIDCEAIIEGRHIDIIEMDAASNTGIEDIKQIIDGVRYAPVSARYKVYIIDEIHMLSDKAFNALLKTLEEPPPHAKFIFATTEIRKVPITVLSRCQRFDLRRVDAGLLTAHFKDIAQKENVQVDDPALALIARAAEGSVRDGLSILDQAIAHTNGNVDTASVRDMLGLADRGRIVDLFEHIMAGRIVEALHEFKSQYDSGADPVVVLNDLADFTHLVTRLRYVPGAAASDISLSPDESERGLAFSQKLPVSVLGRTWQMLLKGIAETQNSSRPFEAAEMLLIRLGHVANLPTLEDAVKMVDAALADDPAPSRGSSGGALGPSAATPTAPLVSPGSAAQIDNAIAPQNAPTMRIVSGATATAQQSAPDFQAAPAPDLQQAKTSGMPQPEPIAVPLNSLQDIADLAEKKRDPLLKVNIRKCVRLVSIEPGRLAINVTDDAPGALVGDIARKLHDWTGVRWMVSISRDQGGPTLEEVDNSKRDALFADASRDPEIAKILANFPGAKIIDVRVADTGESTDIMLQDSADDMLENPDDDAEL